MSSRLRLAALAAAALAIGPAARAQTTTPNPSVNPQQFGRADCLDNRQVTFSWDLGTAFQTGALVQANLSNGTDCSTPSGAPTLSNVPQTQTGTLSLSASQLVFAQSAGCNANVASGQAVSVYFCVKFAQNGSTSTPISVPVTYALSAPTPPIDLLVAEGDQHLKLSWTQGNATDKVATYTLYAADLGAAQDADGGVCGTAQTTTQSDAGTSDAGTDAGPPSDDAGTSDAGSTAGDGGSASLEQVSTNIASAGVDFGTFHGAPLVDGDVYAVAVSAVDSFGNVSDPSTPACGRPRQIDDFYSHYRNDGGAATGGGGCSSLGGAGWLVALLGAALFLVRRRKSGGALLVLAALSLPSAARAQEPGDISQVLKRDERPPRRLLFALKIDRYAPQIDSDPSLKGNTPYRDIFGGRAPLRWQLEADWEVAHPFGTFLVGGTLGYWQNIGHGVEHGGTAATADTALLDVMPFGAIATYRFDYAADRLNIPLIPYAQVGLQAALWASFNGRGDVVTRCTTDASGHNDCGRGSGWTTGWTSALGLALSLDWIDPSLAREAFNDVHIQRTALFAEYGWTHLDGFGKTGALILSDRAWRFGLSLEF